MCKVSYLSHIQNKISTTTFVKFMNSIVEATRTTTMFSLKHKKFIQTGTKSPEENF